jgi:hypothetical protein
MSRLNLYQTYVHFCAEQAKFADRHHVEAIANWKQLQEIWQLLTKVEEMLVAVSPLIGCRSSDGTSSNDGRRRSVCGARCCDLPKVL